MPEGYSADWLNAEILLQATVGDGALVLPSGMRYRLLVLPDDVDRLTLPMVEKLRDLVAAGATILGPRPGKTARAGYAACAGIGAHAVHARRAIAHHPSRGGQLSNRYEQTPGCYLLTRPRCLK